MGRRDREPPHQQILIYNPVKQLCRSIHDLLGGRGILPEIEGAMGVFWDPAAIVIPHNLPVIPFSPLGILQILDVIAHRDNKLVGDQPLFHQIQREEVRHFPEHQPRLVRLIGLMQHLSRSQAVVLRPVCFDRRDGAGLPAPRVVDEKFRIFAEQR